MVDEMGLRKTFTALAEVTICKLLTQKVVMGFPLSIMWGHTLDDWVNMAHIDVLRIVGEQRASYPL